MHFIVQTVFFLMGTITTVKTQTSLQYCPEEISRSEIAVTWYQSVPGDYIRSKPLCIHNDSVVTRNCTNEGWVPPLYEVLPCDTAPKYFHPKSCPPGFKTISHVHTRYCYQIKDPSQWDDPCFHSGGATVISELNITEIDFLLNSLRTTNYTFFWLPAQRPNMLFPFVWLTPGPNWGRTVNANGLIPFNPSILKTCLLLDVQRTMLVSDFCRNEYPSLCIYRNDFHHPAKCPDNYQAFRNMLDDGICFGIEKSDTKLTFEEFLSSNCNVPMGNEQYGDHGHLRRYIYSKLALDNHIPDDVWCWFAAPIDSLNLYNLGLHNNNTTLDVPRFLNVINNNGSIALMTSDASLSCMACEAKMTYSETELILEYYENIQLFYLSVYFPSSLWKYDSNDKGVQCFSDADGFSRVIEIHEYPIFDVVHNKPSNLLDNLNEEKEIYVINLVTERSARYWCEGHTKSFSLLTTEKIVVNPLGNLTHVFALVLNSKMDVYDIQNMNLIGSDLITNITKIFNAKKALVMDILEYQSEIMQVLLHLHVTVNYTYQEESRNLQKTLEFLKSKAEVEFPEYQYELINISSAVLCFPTTSVDTMTLTWDITPIGHIAAPEQFCLQANGLPVNRQCHGSYLLGSYWGEVQGQCDTNHMPTNITTFLFNFIKGKTSHMSKFLTVGLKFVFEDLNILIPADIYYLSLSFRQISFVGRKDMSSIETGDIENIAWIMDRMMNVSNNNLRLAQTLNSTNAILDSTNDLIELITVNNVGLLKDNTMDNTYALAVQPRFIVQVSYPELSNITGMAVIRNKNTDNFTDMVIKPLYKNTTLDDILLMNDLEVATWLPYYLLDNLQKRNNETDPDSIGTNPMHVVIKVYNDNAVFQELNNNKNIVNSRIVEVTIPDYETNLEYPLPIIFKERNYQGFSKACGYWDFKTEKGNIPGSWSKRGCFLKDMINNLTICECYHLTHFAQLIRNDEIFENSTFDEKHEKALNIITLIGSFLSLLGIAGIWITATVFDTWRKKAGTRVLLQLSFSIALPLILIIFFNLNVSIITESQGCYMVPRNKVVICVGLGAMFHYSVLANFMWMLITAILQFIRYVQVLGVSRPSRFMTKITLIGWGLPFIPVIAVLVLDYENYIPNPSSSRSFCYPNGIYMISGVIVPICIVLLTNIILFLLVIKSISKSNHTQAIDKSLLCAQLRLSVFLFFLLGLTWIFGVASFSGSLMWSYLFCLTSTLQGLVLFIYFVICDPNTRNMWITVMKPQFSRSKSSITTTSSG